MNQTRHECQKKDLSKISDKRESWTENGQVNDGEMSLKKKEQKKKKKNNGGQRILLLAKFSDI